MQEKIIKALANMLLDIAGRGTLASGEEISILPELARIVLDYPFPVSNDSPDKNELTI